jgi:adenylate cyclase
LIGQIEEGRRSLAEANRLAPFMTVRSFVAPIGDRGLPNPGHMARVERMRQGLRIAGLREYAEEDTDFGVTSDGTLHRDLLGLTPSGIAGATTIRTNELVDLLVRRKPVLIDVAFISCGRSLPGAVGLQGLGHGFSFSDRVQSRFRRTMHELTDGDLSAPIVVYCANAERFTGHNLALRLVALGYTQVFWYRGGWEAWQVAGQPDTELELRSW